MESLGECIKSFRRGVYVANGGYNCLVICPNGPTLDLLFDETLRILAASSLEVKAVNYLKRSIHTERDGMIKFKLASVQPDTLRGIEWPHIINMGCALPRELEEMLITLNRSHNEAVTPKWQEASL